MKEFNYIIKDPIGMHARPAGLFVKQASGYDSKIMIKKGDKEVDAKRILGVMQLGIKSGDEITIIADGNDEDLAVKGLEQFLQNNL